MNVDVIAFTHVFAGADYTSITGAEPALAMQVPNSNLAGELP
jgi:hypothetical protein